jgi:hypothetical protein
MITDRFVRRIVGPVLLLLFVLISTPAIVAVSTCVATQGYTEDFPRWAVVVLEFYRTIQDVPSKIGGLDVVAQGIQILPALLSALFFRPTPTQPRLNGLGRVTLVYLLISIALGAVAVGLIDPPEQELNFPGGRESIERLELACTSTFRTSLTYLLILLGVRIQVQEVPTPAPAGRTQEGTA